MDKLKKYKVLKEIKYNGEVLKVGTLIEVVRKPYALGCFWLSLNLANGSLECINI